MFRSHTLRIGILGVIVVILVLTLWNTTAAGKYAPEASQPLAQLPLGTFTMQLSSSDLDPAFLSELSGTSADNYLGGWELKLDEQHKFTASNENGIKIEGLYSNTSEQVMFYGGSWSAACADTGDAGRRPYHAPGTYSFNYDGTNLTLKAGAEDCQARKQIVSAHPLVLFNSL